MSTDDQTPPTAVGCDEPVATAGDLSPEGNDLLLDEEEGAAAAFAELCHEVGRLRRTLLKQGHAQERLHARLEGEIRRLSPRQGPSAPAAGDAILTGAAGAARSAAAAGTSPAGAAASATGLTVPQQRVLMELDQAVERLLDLARQVGSRPAAASAAAAAVAAAAEPGEEGPQTLREGLVLLQVRVHNLQRSFGLETIPARGRPFDDRCHQARGVCERPDLADGVVAEELLPGYRLRGEVVRPALVIVNRRRGPGNHA